MVEDVVGGDEHLAGDCDDGSIVSPTFHDSQVELAGSWVVACGVLGGFEEYPADVTVSFLRDWTVCCVVARLVCAGCEACVADKLLGDPIILELGVIGLVADTVWELYGTGNRLWGYYGSPFHMIRGTLPIEVAVLYFFLGMTAAVYVLYRFEKK